MEISNKYLSSRYVRNMKELVAGNTLPATGSFGHELLSFMLDQGWIQKVPNEGKRGFHLTCPHPELLDEMQQRFLEPHLSLDQLEEYIGNKDNIGCRQELGNYDITDTKFLRIKTFPHFHLACFDNIRCKRNGDQCLLSPLPYGHTYAIWDPDAFSIEEDVVVVGLENYENLFRVERYRSMLPDGKYVFVARDVCSLSEINRGNDDQIEYKSCWYTFRKWMQNKPNKYLHIGDLDFSGIMIFETNCLKSFGSARSSFFVPTNYEDLIKKGEHKRFLDQYRQWQQWHGHTDSRLNPLIGCIEKYQKGFDQEFL